MTRAEMLAELRRVLNAAGTDVTWSDTELIEKLAEGQDQFCEDTGYFIDKSNFSITLEDGTSSYTIEDRVIQILEVWDGTRKLDKILTGNIITSAPAGDPAQWQTDIETGKVHFDRTPTSEQDGDTFILHVWRYSQNYLADVGAEPEIPSRFHQAPIEWAAFKAFNHHDIERQDPVKAKDHFEIYQYYARKGKQAFRRYHNVESRVAPSPVYNTGR